MDQPVQVSESDHHFLYYPVQTLSSHVQQYWFFQWVRNTNDKERIIPPGYYTIGETIAMLNTMTDTTFSISTKASSNGCIWIQSPHTIDFTNAPDIREILGLEGYTIILPASFYGKNVIDITRNRQLCRCIHRLCNPPIWRLPTRTTICSPHWSLMIPSATIVDWWRISAFQ